MSSLTVFVKMPPCPSLFVVNIVTREELRRVGEGDGGSARIEELTNAKTKQGSGSVIFPSGPDSTLKLLLESVFCQKAY
jgi:hypothetical protein